MNSYSFSIDYLTKLIDEFKCLYMTIDGTFELIIFPEIIATSEHTKFCKIKNYIDSHKFIYLRTVSMLQKREILINTKIQYKLPIVEVEKRILSKYLLKDKNVINIIEIGFSVFHSDRIVTRNGEEMQIIQFITDLGHFFGEEIQYVYQRIDEMKNRANPHKYLDVLKQILKKE